MERIECMVKIGHYVYALGVYYTGLSTEPIIERFDFWQNRWKQDMPYIKSHCHI